MGRDSFPFDYYDLVYFAKVFEIMTKGPWYNQNLPWLERVKKQQKQKPKQVHFVKVSSYIKNI